MSGIDWELVAAAYAWGRQDERDTGPTFLHNERAKEFGRAYKRYVCQHPLVDTSRRVSLKEAFMQWNATGKIERR